MGLKLNFDKTQVLRVGSMRDSYAKYYADWQLQWSDKIKVLGITLSANIHEAIKINYQELLAKMEVSSTAGNQGY